MIFATILFLFGGSLFWGAIKQHRRVRQIEDTPSSKAATAPQGLVELQGFVWPVEKTFFISGQREVVYYSCEVQYAPQSWIFFGKLKRWKTVAKRANSVPFYVIDQTGIVRIEPQGAETFLDGTHADWKDAAEDLKSDLLAKEFKAPIPVLSHMLHYARNFIQKNSISVIGFFTLIIWAYDKSLFSEVPHYPPLAKDKRYRITESWIEVGSPLYVSGTFLTGKKEMTSLSSKGLTPFVEKIFASSFQSLNEVAKSVPSEKLKEDHVTLAVKLRNEKSDSEEKSYPIHGQIGLNAQHGLFIGDRFEFQLKDKLKDGLQLRFIFGAMVMTAGVLWFSPLVQSRETRIKNLRTMASIAHQPLPMEKRDIPKADLAQLHQSCVQGNKIACSNLVQNHKIYQLPDQNFVYYKNRLKSLQTQ